MGFFKRSDKQRKTSDPSNPDLILAMQAVAANDNPNTRKSLYEQLLKSVLFIPTYGEQGIGSQGEWREISESTKATIIMGKDREGKGALLVFTDTQAMLSWKPEGCNYIAMPAQHVFKTAIYNQTSSIIVNIAGPTSGTFTASEIKGLAEGIIPPPFDPSPAPFSIPPGTNVIYGMPAKRPPEEFIAKVQEALAMHNSIKAGYLFQMMLGSEVKPHIVIGIVFAVNPDRQQANKIFNNIGTSMQPLIEKDTYVDFVVLEGEMLTDVKKMDGALIFESNQQ